MAKEEKLRHGEPPIVDKPEKHIPPAEFAELCNGYAKFIDAANSGNTTSRMMIVHAAALFQQEKKPDLTPVQDMIYRVLTKEYQSARAITKASGVDFGQVRRELPNLKRMDLVEHENRVGYRRK